MDIVHSDLVSRLAFYIKRNLLLDLGLSLVSIWLRLAVVFFKLEFNQNQLPLRSIFF